MNLDGGHRSYRLDRTAHERTVRRRLYRSMIVRSVLALALAAGMLSLGNAAGSIDTFLYTLPLVIVLMVGASVVGLKAQLAKLRPQLSHSDSKISSSPSLPRSTIAGGVGAE